MNTEAPSKNKLLSSLSSEATKHHARAKYYPQPDGTFRLACIQQFNTPRFCASGWETRTNVRDKKSRISEEEIEDFETGREASTFDIERATRRARKNAFDIIMCNPDLDIFCTFTYSPEKVDDKADYDECYKYLNTYLSNRVQRNGLKYVCVPERTKKGDIHFHAIMNADALKLVEARSPNTNRKLTHNGKQLYNITDWARGFTSCEFITRSGDEDEREAVSKYIFKYMGKQEGQKIGGRYCLIGGDVQKPIYVYGDTAEELFDGTPCKFEIYKEFEGVEFREFSYI